MKNILAASLLFAAVPAAAEVQVYTKYENEMLFINEDYVDNSSLNSGRVGLQTTNFYFEVGPAFLDGEVGSSFEAGYVFPFGEHIEVRGEVEGYQIDSFEGDVGSRLETEVRYYF